MAQDIVDGLDGSKPVLLEEAYVPAPISRWSWRFRVFKKCVDILFVLTALPILVVLSVLLLLLNPLLNPGPLFFKQDRMGMGSTRFKMWKYRTMKPSGVGVRAHNAPLDADRITPLGHFLRRSRIDELPNAINIIRGEMTLIGPRPDAWTHAETYIATVPYYRDRFRVKPGITGIAQVRDGYADTARAVERKARYDRFYVRRSSGRFDVRILLATIAVVTIGKGAK